MKTYGNSTEEYLNNVPAKSSTDYILKEIAQNLAYIADELSSQYDDGYESPFDYEPGFKRPVEEETKPKVAFIRDADEVLKCFICEGDVDFTDAGGLIMTSEGDVYCACAKCKDKFDNFVKHFVIPYKADTV